MDLRASSGHTDISFWARALASPLSQGGPGGSLDPPFNFRIILRTEGSTTDISANFQVTASETWQKITIPLSAFGSDSALNGVNYVAFMVTTENSFSTLSGTLWIDDLEITP